MHIHTSIHIFKVSKYHQFSKGIVWLFLLLYIFVSLVFSVFLILAILVGMWWYWVMVCFFFFLIFIELYYVYRHNLFYFTSLCYTLQILYFLQIENLCQASLLGLFFQIYWDYLLTLCLCVTFGNSCNISDFFFINLFIMVISDLWCYYYDLLKAQMIISIFSNKLLLN